MRKLFWLLGFLMFLGLGFTLGFWYYVFAPTGRFVPSRVVSVRKGESLTTVAHHLADAGVVHSALAFVIYAETSGKAGRVQPGDYAFAGGERVRDVLRHLINGDFMVVTVTIPEGMTVHQIGEKLEEAGLVCDNEFDAAAFDGDLPRELGLGPLGVEGFLFPATYRFSPLATTKLAKKQKTDEILAAMLERFFAVLTPQAEERMFELDLTPRELVTLASVIEREAKVSGERPIIASVFYNRLARGMPLQSDPTAQYNFAGETVRAVVAVRALSAFNTYDFAGLPPGPIANPGLLSIRAALYPAHTDYLYFVARNDGTHVFSRSFKEHERAIEEVRRIAAQAHRPRS